MENDVQRSLVQMKLVVGTISSIVQFPSSALWQSYLVSILSVVFLDLLQWVYVYSNRFVSAVNKNR
jgi:hypothetical protein